MSEAKKVFEYTVFVRGLFGRNRTEKSKSFPLGIIVPQETPKTVEELMPRFREELAKQKVKPGARVALYQEKVELEEKMLGGHLVTTKLIEVFGGAKIYEEVLA